MAHLLDKICKGALVQKLKDKGDLATVWHPIGSQKLHQSWVRDITQSPDVVHDLFTLLLYHSRPASVLHYCRKEFSHFLSKLQQPMVLIISSSVSMQRLGDTVGIAGAMQYKSSGTFSIQFMDFIATIRFAVFQ